MFPTYLSWINMVNSDSSEAIKRKHAYVIQMWFEPPHWQFWVYHPGGNKASFFHWLLILVASILWLSPAARASDKQPKPNPTQAPTPAIAFLPTPTETRAPTSAVNDSGGQVFNVKTCGAVGNGSTNDTAAIRSAITAASATGGIVFFPRGVFVLPSLLTCKSFNNVSFQGSGKSITILKSTIPAGTPARNGAPTMLSFSNCANFSIRDITFDNNNIITTALQTCLVSVSSSYFSYRYLTFTRPLSCF
jgi:polygalacturonase